MCVCVCVCMGVRAYIYIYEESKRNGKARGQCHTAHAFSHTQSPIPVLHGLLFIAMFPMDIPDLIRHVTFIDRNNIKYYALFPAINHMDHLNLILKNLGVSQYA